MLEREATDPDPYEDTVTQIPEGEDEETDIDLLLLLGLIDGTEYMHRKTGW